MVAAVVLLFVSTILSITTAFQYQILPQRHERCYHRSVSRSSLRFTTAKSSTSFTNNNGIDGEMDPDSSNRRGVGTLLQMSNIDPSTCAFRGRYYPRIVPIPIRKRRKEEMRADYNKFWWPGQRNYIRNRFVQQQSNATCRVEWVDASSSIAQTSTKSKYNNLLTFASLWNIVGKVTANMQDMQARIDDNGNSSNQNRTRTTVVALPDADGYIVVQFVVVVQWLLERQQQQQQQQAHAKIIVSYRDTSIDFVTIPTMVVTLHERSLLKRPPAPSPSTTTTTTMYHHHVITQRTKSWVQRILVDTTICPFTKSITYSGQGLSDVNVPVGKIAYHTSESAFMLANDTDTGSSWSNIITAVCQLQSDVLVAIHDMLQAGPTYSTKQKLDGISSILLAAPGWDDHLELWTRIVFPILEAVVQVLDLKEEIGIVCFHPYYQTPDGRSFPGFGHMHSVPRLQQWLRAHVSQADMEMAIENSIPDLLASHVINSPPEVMARTKEDGNHHHSNHDNAAVSAIAAAGGAWQRRTPHATINVLRADQLAAAESKRSTSTLYSTNILRLNRIGWTQLQNDLNRERNMQ